MNYARLKHRLARGYSMVEVLVSGSIVAAGLTFAAAMQVYTDHNNALAAQRIEMVVDAQRCLIDVMDEGYVNIIRKFPGSIGNDGNKPLFTKPGVMLTNGKQVTRTYYVRDTSGTGIWPPVTDPSDPAYYHTGFPSFLVTCETTYDDALAGGNNSLQTIKQSTYIYAQ